MAVVLLCGYLSGWIVTSLLAALLAKRWRDAKDPAPHSVALSVAAGAAWPVLLIALAEAGVVALTAEVLHDDEPTLSYQV